VAVYEGRKKDTNPLNGRNLNLTFDSRCFVVYVLCCLFIHFWHNGEGDTDGKILFFAAFTKHACIRFPYFLTSFPHPIMLI